jgi:protein dithiol oxidoreductase (disulfide-forming)
MTTSPKQDLLMFKVAPVLFVVLAAFSGSLLAQSFEEGTHYHRIGTPVTVPEDRVEVVEAFAYPCPACRNFHPHIARWENEAPDFVDFRRLPVAIQRGWEVFALAYNTATVMGLGDDAHAAVFKALHDERRQIRSFEDLAAIYTEFDVTAESFINTSQSFAVDSRMRRDRADTMRYGVRQTPTMIIQGKWRLSPSGFDSMDHFFAAVDFLIAREAEELGLEGGKEADQVASSGEQAEAAAVQ